MRATKVTKQLFYVEVDTPDGRFGKDIDIVYNGEGNKLEEAIPKPAEASPFSDAIFSRPLLLSEAEGVLSELSDVPAIAALDRDKIDFLYNANAIFRGSAQVIIEHLASTAKSRDIGTLHRYQPAAPVCLLVTAFPWSSAESPAMLARFTGSNEAGYTKFLDSIASNRAADHLTHWAHISITMTDGRLHAAAGVYQSAAGSWRALHLPEQLLTAKERAA